MLLLFVEKKFNISDSNKIELINFLCKYFIRRNVTDSPPTRDLTNYFMDIIVEVNKLEQYDYDKIRSIILEKGKPANDILFEDKLKGDLYEENVGATRYILSSIELTESQTKDRVHEILPKESQKESTSFMKWAFLFYSGRNLFL